MIGVRIRADALWDLVALGEVMVRFDPGEERIHTARAFRVWEGGGEYNVARGLARAFGLRTTIVTALVDNPVGRLIEDLILQGGVDRSHVRWVDYDGVGRVARNGLNFTERGFGVRGAVGMYDRGHTAASQLRPGDVDWERIFDGEGARWFHTSTIFAALSETTPDLIKEAMEAARQHGVVVSYDLNHRPSLWEAVGGEDRAREVNRSFVHLIDVLLGGDDLVAALGLDPGGLEPDLPPLDPTNFGRMAERLVTQFPNVKVVAAPLRRVETASRNDWGAACWADGRLHEATRRPGLEILDRVGGGDAFASGLISAFLAGKGPSDAVEYGAAHGALTMTTPGDNSMVVREEVERLLVAGAPRIRR